MWYKYPLGGIFILKRNLIISVAFVLAWILLTTYVIFKSYDKRSFISETMLAKEDNNAVSTEQTTTENNDDVKEKETEPETEKESNQEVKKERVTGVASRSGSTLERSKKAVYFEEISLSFTEEEIEILERIVEAEAGGNNYDGKLAVVNVVLNRVLNERFPNTVKEVVFAHRQFTPVSDGRYYKVKVSETTKEAVKDALEGKRIIGKEALYFCTPTAPGKGWFETDLKKIDYIAPHNFYGYK